mmetsp:Transcript_34516/g.77548  ORF Transcript_34516/g.77548 Transcript_34516/m.77548 type:complete len:609 (-) Transcript_34516:1111-2937(-)
MFLIYIQSGRPKGAGRGEGAQGGTGASLAAVAPARPAGVARVDDPAGPGDRDAAVPRRGRQAVALVRDVLVVVPPARLVAVALAPDGDGRDARPEAAGADVHAGTRAAAAVAAVAGLARALLAARAAEVVARSAVAPLRAAHAGVVALAGQVDGTLPSRVDLLEVPRAFLFGRDGLDRGGDGLCGREGGFEGHLLEPPVRADDFHPPTEPARAAVVPPPARLFAVPHVADVAAPDPHGDGRADSVPPPAEVDSVRSQAVEAVVAGRAAQGGVAGVVAEGPRPDLHARAGPDDAHVRPAAPAPSHRRDGPRLGAAGVAGLARVDAEVGVAHAERGRAAGQADALAEAPAEGRVVDVVADQAVVALAGTVVVAVEVAGVPLALEEGLAGTVARSPPAAVERDLPPVALLERDVLLHDHDIPGPRRETRVVLALPAVLDLDLLDLVPAPPDLPGGRPPDHDGARSAERVDVPDARADLVAAPAAGHVHGRDAVATVGDVVEGPLGDLTLVVRDLGAPARVGPRRPAPPPEPPVVVIRMVGILVHLLVDQSTPLLVLLIAQLLELDVVRARLHPGDLVRALLLDRARRRVEVGVLDEDHGGKARAEVGRGEE